MGDSSLPPDQGLCLAEPKPEGWLDFLDPDRKQDVALLGVAGLFPDPLLADGMAGPDNHDTRRRLERTPIHTVICLPRGNMPVPPNRPSLLLQVSRKRLYPGPVLARRADEDLTHCPLVPTGLAQPTARSTAPPVDDRTAPSAYTAGCYR